MGWREKQEEEGEEEEETMARKIAGIRKCQRLYF